MSMATPQQQRHRLLSLLGTSILLTSLSSIHTAVRLTHEHDVESSISMKWWTASIYKSSKHTTNTASSSLSSIHPWLVRQQSHSANPMPCQTRLWYKNKTRANKDCFPSPISATSLSYTTWNGSRGNGRSSFTPKDSTKVSFQTRTKSTNPVPGLHKHGKSQVGRNDCTYMGQAM